MKIKFRDTYTVHRWRVLIFILLFSLLTQWTRWLPVYLSSVSIDECDDACQDVAFEPVCIDCIQDTDTTTSLTSNETYAACNECRLCRIEYDSKEYNLQDGVCMTTTQYGLITGLGFSLTFSTFGLLAGFLVDQSSERGSTILGCSALICGVVTLLSSFCINFSETLILRAILGGMQAFGAPASVHLITTYFRRPSERPFANASYTIGLYFGAGLSSLSTIFAKDYLGWRNIYILVGWISIGVSILYEIFVDLDIELVTNDINQNNIGKETVNENVVIREAENERSPLMKSHAHLNAHSPKLQSPVKDRPVTPTSPFHPPSNEDDRLNDTMDMDTDNFESEIAAISSPIRGKEIIKSNVSTPINFAVSRDDGFKYERDISYTTLHEIVHHDENEDALSDVNSVRQSGFNRLSADHSDTESNVSEYSNHHSVKRSIFEKQSLLKDQDPLIHFISIIRGLFFGGSVPYALPVLFCASCLRFIGSIATFVYIPLLISRRFPSEDKSFSIFNAIVVLSCGSISAFAGGKIGQIVVKSFGLSGLAKLVALSCLLSIVPFMLAFTSTNFWMSMTMLALGYLIGELWMGGSMALLQALSPKKGQGLSMSVYLFINWNAAAVMIDFLGWLDPGTDNISNEMLLGVSLPIFGSFLFFGVLDRILVQNEISTMNYISRRNDI